MLLPTFSDFATVYDLQDTLLGDDPEAAIKAVRLSMYGSNLDLDPKENFVWDLNSLQAAIYGELIWPNGANGEFTFPVLYKTDDDIKTFSSCCRSSEYHSRGPKLGYYGWFNQS